MIISGNRSDARAAERRTTSAASTMRTDGGDPVDVVVLDISQSGVRILTSADLLVGQEISIGLAGAGVTRAFISWRRHDQYGCAFERPMSVEDAAAAFSNAKIVRLGTHETPPVGDEDYLLDLYRKHRIWALPPDAIIMAIALIAATWLVFFRH